jgi:prepilin peptidase CpaA
MLTLPPPPVQVVLLAVVIAAAVYDMRYRRIPNWISVGGAVIGIALNAFLEPPPGGWVFAFKGAASGNFSLVLGAGHPTGAAFALKGMALGFGAYFVLYLLHAMGAGDVKLMAAVGSLVGGWDWVGIFVLTAILGGIAAICLATMRKRLGETLWNVGFILSELKSGRPAYLGREELDVRSSKAVGLPHGAVIALATICFLGMSAYFTR